MLLACLYLAFILKVLIFNCVYACMLIWICAYLCMCPHRLEVGITPFVEGVIDSLSQCEPPKVGLGSQT